MRINEIIPFALNQVQRSYTFVEHAITSLFERIFGTNQPNAAPVRLENDITPIEADPAVQQIAEKVLAENKPSESSMQASIDNLKSIWNERIANKETKSLEACETVCKEAVNIFGKRQDEDNRFKSLFPLLDEFEFDQVQKRRIYAAITGTSEDSPQVSKLFRSATPFKDFAEVYTLRFVDGEIEASKAELSTYGNYFTARFSSIFNQNSNLLDLTEIPIATGYSRVDMLQIDKETFQVIQRFIKGEIGLDLEDPESLETIKILASYFQVEDIGRLFCKTIDEAISAAREYKLQDINLMKYEGDLTDKHIGQILSLPGLRRIGGKLDLKALFPKLSIIGEEVWKKHADMADAGLNVDAVDERAAIRNLHDMYRKLEVENNAGITLIQMPKGLTLNKLIAIAKTPLEGNPIGCRTDDEILNVYGDNPIMKGYTIAITDSVLYETRNRTPSTQKMLLQQKGVEMPGLLDMMALTLMTFVSSSDKSKKRLFDDPSATSRVAEKFGHDRHLIVGGYSSFGLRVTTRNKMPQHGIGVAGLRKF